MKKNDISRNYYQSREELLEVNKQTAQVRSKTSLNDYGSDDVQWYIWSEACSSEKFKWDDNNNWKVERKGQNVAKASRTSWNMCFNKQITAKYKGWLEG